MALDFLAKKRKKNYDTTKYRKFLKIVCVSIACEHVMYGIFLQKSHVSVAQYILWCFSLSCPFAFAFAQ